MAVKVENLSQLQQKLRHLPAEIREVAVEEVQDAGQRIRDGARAECRDPEVRETIKKRRLARGLNAKVGTEHWRAKFEEFGTSGHAIEPKAKQALAGPEFGPVAHVARHPGQPARPYMGPAAERERREFPARLAAAINTALHRIARR